MVIINLNNKSDRNKFKDKLNMLSDTFHTTKYAEIYGCLDKGSGDTKVEFVFYVEREPYKLVKVYDKKNYGTFFDVYNHIFNWDSVKRYIDSIEYNTLRKGYFNIVIKR